MRSQSDHLLDTRGYCVRASLCSYSLGVPNYKITFPSKSYPSTAPYSTLSNYFKALVKDGLLHRLVIKALLYPEFIRQKSTDKVRLRRNHRTTSFRRRQSICSSSDLSQRASESNDACESSVTSSIGFVRYCPNRNSAHSSDSENTFLDHGPGVAVDCTRDIFASIEKSMTKSDVEQKVAVVRDSDGSLIFAHSQDDCDINRDSLKYYTKPVKVVIERSASRNADSLIHTSTAQMFIGTSLDEKEENLLESKGSPSEDSVLSEYDRRSIRAHMACEDLVNMDESMKCKTVKTPLCKKLPSVDERHSMPTLFVGNRFNCSSLTEVFIPSYKEKLEIKYSENNSNETLEEINNSSSSSKHSNRNSNASTATHSSSVDIPPVIPAPDKLSAELLYNPNGSPPRENSDSCHFVIKPPSMFGSKRNLTPSDSPNQSQRSSLNIFRMGTDKKQSITFQHIADDKSNIQFPAPPDRPDDDKSLNQKKKCGCCVQPHSPCVSQRSSDSGMAGSCTISPDAPPSNTGNEYDPLDERFLPNIGDRLDSLMHSRSTHNFGRFNDIPFADSNHDSGQYGNDESESEQHRDSSAVKNMFELSSSQDTVRRKSRCQSAEPQPEKEISEEVEVPHSSELSSLYRTGMYAHWWKKTPLPSAMLKDIYGKKLRKESNSSAKESTDDRGSGKQFSIVLWFFSLLLLHTHNFIHMRACVCVCFC